MLHQNDSTASLSLLGAKSPLLKNMPYAMQIVSAFHVWWRDLQLKNSKELIPDYFDIALLSIVGGFYCEKLTLVYEKNKIEKSGIWWIL